MIKPIPKPERHLNPEYLEYLRDQPCCACGKKTTVVRTHPHHLITVKAGGADETACPLCFNCHVQVGWGLKKFEEKHSVNLWMESKRFELAFRGVKIKA